MINVLDTYLSSLEKFTFIPLLMMSRMKNGV
jgi:hypothetical protein